MKTLISVLRLAVLLSVIMIPFQIQGQTMQDFGFERITTISVYDDLDKSLDLAWTGGLNACQFHRLDLNMNGTEDLVIFDKHGNRILPFLNDNSGGEFAFSFAPEFIHHFPEMQHWVKFIDYDGDGRKDIFTYTVGGVKVYRNISDTILKFSQVTRPFILSKYGSIFTNLLVTSVDYPAILDMDGDGDLDILTFWGLGTFLEKHTNRSVDHYGHRDSLLYEKTEYCWGYFAENEESNEITLDTCVNFKALIHPFAERKSENRHVGSTLLLLDITHNGLKDLILGDIDYPSLYLLKNTGTPDSAFIDEVDTFFPSNTRPVNLFSFPVADYVDITGNGVNDLVVSPFDPSLRRSNHHKSVWFYENTGTNEAPVFDFVREDLFQHRMIDVGAGSKPVIADINNDGLPDLIIANYGYLDTCTYDQFMLLSCKYVSRLSYYQNTGSAGNPEFKMVTDDFAGLSVLGLKALYPAFADITNNGKLEMLLGNENGRVMLFTDKSVNPAEPDFALSDDFYQQISVGGFSTPQLIDLNNNGLYDLVIGQINGKLSYYQNQGSASNPQFVKITDEFGQVNVTDPLMSYSGYSVPCFFKTKENELRLFVGSESGRIFYYKDIENNLDGSFSLEDNHLLLINEGIHTGTAVAFFTGDNYPDMIIGNYSGGLSFYKGSSPRPTGLPNLSDTYGNDVQIFPNPAASQLNVILASVPYDQVLIELRDMTGRIVYRRIDGRKDLLTVDTRSVKSGMYILQLSLISHHGSEAKIIRRKILVKN